MIPPQLNTHDVSRGSLFHAEQAPRLKETWAFVVSPCHSTAEPINSYAETRDAEHEEAAIQDQGPRTREKGASPARRPRLAEAVSRRSLCPALQEPAATVDRHDPVGPVHRCACQHGDAGAVRPLSRC